MNILSQPLFLHFFVPLITVVFTVFIKVVSRSDRLKRFKKEDLAIGLDIAVIALIIFITESANLAQELTSPSSQTLTQTINKLTVVPWVFFGFFLGIWGVSSLIRYFGWREDGDLKIGWGIIAPDIFGIFLLIFVVNWIR